MYDEFETKTSFEYLKTVIKNLNSPICLLGGWAVYFTVNENFRESFGRDYIGSRDIDLGYHIDLEWDVKQLKASPIVKSLKILEEGLGFRAVSFRLMKEFHIDEKEEILRGRSVPQHMIFPLYVDIIVDNIHPKFRDTFKFNLIDEPFLKFVFGDPQYRRELGRFDKKLWLPKPELLLATKLSSVTNRDKVHKKIKDLADIYAILWFSRIGIEEMKSKVRNFLTSPQIGEILNRINPEDLERAAQALELNYQQVKEVIFKLKED